jgi:hypothetical protein
MVTSEQTGNQTASDGGVPANQPASLGKNVDAGELRYGWTMNGVAIEVVVKDGCSYVNGDLVHVVKQNK